MSGIPVLHVEADCIARAWEESLVNLYRNGCSIHTEYDKAGDPPSKDSTMILTITDPLSRTASQGIRISARNSMMSPGTKVEL